MENVEKKVKLVTKEGGGKWEELKVYKMVIL